ncbi:MAG: hypothetical protein KDC43_06160 [Saprospiraceae bacterium]|nr:hypothetical protein [Saprospiraceae bacterium]MCB0623497.1 hypothetical protein [Saprospiraceae bacterium]MCB0678807.1 hypothetical protein [Saprospiraceae bacterium]MCB0679911.1 hypothetical protein [Saprospiraceae bacterium]
MKQQPGSEETADHDLIVVKYFFFETRARLYAARLRQLDIPCFVSNSNTATAIPFGGGGIGLHVRRTDAPRALALIHEMDRMQADDPPAEDYRDASREDIEFLQALDRGSTAPRSWWLWILGLLIALLLARALFRALGLTPLLDSF